MASDWDFEHYQVYLGRLSDDIQLALSRLAPDAPDGWGLRSLSRSEFAALDNRTKDDDELRERWLRRLKIGYDRERVILSQEIEDGFADLPYAGELANRERLGDAA